MMAKRIKTESDTDMVCICDVSKKLEGKTNAFYGCNCGESNTHMARVIMEYDRESDSPFPDQGAMDMLRKHKQK